MLNRTVTLNIFSGRPNPRWDLTEDQAQELDERLSKKEVPTSDSPPGAVRGLGYRGFEIRHYDHPTPTHIHGGVVGTAGATPNLIDIDREIERFLLTTMPSSGHAADVMTDPVREAIEDDLKTAADAFFRPPEILKLPSPSTCPQCQGVLAPVYSPGAWNIPAVQPSNNCYNYANDSITNTFAQPGRAAGHMYTALTCQSVQPAAVSDGLTAAANFTAPVPNGYYAALVIWPGADFHWYRQDKSGCWSHKPGSTAVRNYDNAGQPITDPRTANRGNYTVFCSFMITYPGHIHIR